MGLAHGREHALQRRLGTEGFQSPFADLLAASLLAHGGIGGVGPKESPSPGEAKAALSVLANVTGTGGKQGVLDLGQVLVGNENDDLALVRTVLAAQAGHLYQP